MTAADASADLSHGAARLNRRSFGALGFAAAVAATFRPAVAQTPEAPQGPLGLSDVLRPAPEGAASYKDVVDLARRRAADAHRQVKRTLSGVFSDLNYDRYRSVRPAPMALGEGRGAMQVDFLPPGFLYDRPVSIALVDQGQVSDVVFDPKVFELDPGHFDAEQIAAAKADGAAGDMGYSGFRVRTPLNRPDTLDEVAVFQGASYFRAVARDLLYGISARGLAIDTAEPSGEEFPSFTKYWIEKPEPEAQTIVARALLESRSCTGAYEFTIAPGDETLMTVRATIFPRETIERVGIAPLTSMFYFGPGARRETDDYRNAVHDSSGLQMITGGDRRLWRALTNPALLQVSAFVDENPKGFGLTQRQRRFDFYQDDEARYEKRPSAWIEPTADWGRGQIVLVEIPSDSEFNDNIVAFWRPEHPLEPSEQGHEFRYRIHWCALPPDAAPLGRVWATRAGAAVNGKGRRSMVVDFRKASPWSEGLNVRASMNGQPLKNVALRPLPDGEGMRASFEFTPGDSKLIEFELTLFAGDTPESETWLYRWTV